MTKIAVQPKGDIVKTTEEAAASDNGLGECDEVTLRKIGKKGAVRKADEGRITVEHPKWMNAIGTEYVDTSEFIAKQLVDLTAPKNKIDPIELSFLTETVMSIAPKDHIEMMLATQMAAVHLMTMNMASSARRATNFLQQEGCHRQLNQLMRTFAVQTEALKKYRNGGKQHVTVKHVHVHEGGQAIVGNVSRGVGDE
jgi:hypothetical protein